MGSEVEPARSTWARMKGLIGRSLQEFTPGRGLWIVLSQGIHTIGMGFPIDAVYLDARGRIIRLYHSLIPGRVAALNWKTRSVLELPAGTLEKTGTQVGDLLEFLPNEEGKE